MTEKIRKIGLEETAQETALRAVYGLLRDIEGNICMIANLVAQNPDLWNRTARYFREFGDNLYMAFILLELLLGEYMTYVDDWSEYGYYDSEVFEEHDEYVNWGS